ncbi:putative aminopeptidase 2 [Mycobacteroides abscessus subsp. abscessus]|nr:putative aminopeptidase 2 [Mycobacteroides abscessus subsp. abscessus]
MFEAQRWPGHSGDYFVVRSGSIVAWRGVDMEGEHAAFRVIGAHTDSPNLRVKANADRVQAGWPMVALEPYGGAWVQTWLDRDLGLCRGTQEMGDRPAVACELGVER